ncbi:outer kinetochore KNL1 complex subunit ZWINT isoform X2 [Caretta caretta]|uniref:outer kinetochore KNL1 complex subunit ZWINT isoform X2 n=1 Tax=Caretta caretta TaxID=8467 RepID=UPI0020951A74|nr:ZW10 interactor isoform X2 [Caretta caretta]
MAAAGQARELLAQLDEALAFEGPTREELEAELPAKVLVEHAVDTRKKQKWMCSQLHVVKFLLEFLDQRDSAPFDQKTTEAAVRNEMMQAKQQWKELKAGYQQQVVAIEGAVPRVLAQLEKGQHLAQRLKEALARYEAQEQLEERKQQLEEQAALLRSRVQAQRQELHRLQGELQSQECVASGWREKVERTSALCQLLETLQGVRVVSASADEIDVELTPGPQQTTPNPQPATPDPQLLRFTLCWAEDGSIRVQSHSPLFPLPRPCADVRGTVLELQQSYGQLAPLLAEIQALQTRFSIDWQPQEHQLRFLQPSAIWTLAVEPGYPVWGRVRLLAVQGQRGPGDPGAWKPPQETPSLRDWLEYLSTLDI